LESQNSKTPEPINKKFGTGDCASEITMQTKNESDRPSGGGLGKWVKFRTRVHVFGFCDPKFCSRLEPKPHSRYFALLDTDKIGARNSQAKT